jgi:gliding motility-associated-like protein
VGYLKSPIFDWMIEQMRTLLSFFILLFFGFVSNAQSPADWWYFGAEAGVHFTTTGPVADTNGVLTTQEGCASVSSAQGDLLFYTDGTWVFNSLHDTMPNGDSLLGNASSTQSAVIVPYPGNATKYYIFTVRGCTGGSTTGASGFYFAYSVVDMNLESGLGDIDTAQKNIVLFDSASEKCTAALHANGSDLWVVGHEQYTDKFHAYHISAQGVVDTVTSTTGSFHTGCVGYMLANHQGNQIVLSTFAGTNGVEIASLDQVTGEIVVTDTLSPPFGMYGIHFSPSDQFLYTAAFSQGLWQYDVTASNIQSTETQVAFVGVGALAEGPDEKIYGAKYLTSYLTVINDPDLPGTLCNFQDSAVFLENRICRIGLPNNVASGLFLIAGFQVSSLCVGDSTYFDMDTANVDAVSWLFGDPASGAANTSNDFFPSHFFSDTGTFAVRLIAQSDTVADTAFQTIRIYPRQSIDLGSDTLICRGVELLLSAAQPYAEFLWHDSTTANTFLTSGDTLVYVSVIGRCDTVSDTIRIAYDDSITMNLGPDTLLCGGQGYTINSNINTSADLVWNNGDSSSTSILITESGLFKLTATNTCGTVDDSVEVTIRPIPAINALGPDTINCFDNEIVLEHPNLDSTTYIWSDSSTKKTYKVDTTETVWLSASNECGSSIDTIIIIFNGEIISELGEDTTICNLDSIVLDASSPGASYVWSTSDTTDSIITDMESKLYVVTITEGLCTTIESKRVDLSDIFCPSIDCRVQVANVITPNGDGMNDTWKVTSDCKIREFDLRIFNRWGQLVFASDNVNIAWDGTVNGEPASDGIYFYEMEFKDTVIVDVDNEEFRGSITLIRD